MEEKPVLDFSSALNALDDVSKSFSVEIWIPSTQSNLTFKEINAKQQKSLLNAAMDTSVYNTGFIQSFYNILKENILSEGANIDSLTLSDKTCIALNLKNQISNQINVVFDEDKNISQKYNLNEILTKFKSYNTPQSTILESNSKDFILKVEISLPTIKTEVDYDNQLKDNKKTEDIKTQEDVKILVVNAFLGETSKFINKVWINDEQIDLNSLKFEQRIKLIEKLPSNLIQKIIDNISVWKKDLDEILTVKHKEYTKTISIDSLLFLN
jgi:hypothetical protein